MNNKKQSYPYPVLGEGDDIEGLFSPQFWVTQRPTIIETEYKFNLENQTLEEMLKNQKIAFVVEIECKTTFFRKTYTINEKQWEIEIPANRLREKVDVSFFLCATQKISDYKPVGLHSDYGKASFVVESGDILADGGSGSFYVTKQFDPLNAPASSFIKIAKGTLKKGPMIIDYEGDFLTIELSEEDHATFLDAKVLSTVHSLHAMLVLPALAEALHVLADQSKKAEYGDKRWFERLQSICREQKIEIDDPFVAAQKILVNPVARGLKEILTLNPSEDE